MFVGRSRISFNLRFKLSLLWFSFRWSTKRNFSEGQVLSVGPSEKVQRELIYFLYVVRKNATNCSILYKICEISVPHNLWTVNKKTKNQYRWCLALNFWTFSGLQIEVERQWPPPPQWLRTFYDKGQDSLFSKKTTLNIEWKKEILSDRSLRSV